MSAAARLAVKGLRSSAMTNRRFVGPFRRDSAAAATPHFLGPFRRDSAATATHPFLCPFLRRGFAEESFTDVKVDTLALIRKMTTQDVSSKHAEVITEVIIESMQSTYSRCDFEKMEMRLDAKIALMEKSLDAKIALMEKSLDAKIVLMEKSLDTKISNLQIEFKSFVGARPKRKLKSNNGALLCCA